MPAGAVMQSARVYVTHNGSWELTASCWQEWAKEVTAGRKTKGDKLGFVDHSKINYPPFRRSFYIEVPDLAKMTEAEVAAHRKFLDNIKVLFLFLPYCQLIKNICEDIEICDSDGKR